MCFLQSVGGCTVGIIPGDDTHDISEHVDIPIVTGLGSARDNINALSSAVVSAAASACVCYICVLYMAWTATLVCCLACTAL